MTKHKSPKHAAGNAIKKASSTTANKPTICAPCLAKAINSGAVMGPLTPEQEKAVLGAACCFKKMSVSAIAPKKRTFVLDVPGGALIGEPWRIAVVGGPSKAPRRMSATLGGGSCTRKKGTNLPLLELRDPSTPKAMEKHGTLEFDAKAIAFTDADMSKWLFPIDVPPTIYSIAPTGCQCGAQARAEVAVFPDITWEGSLSLKFGSLTTSRERRSDDVFGKRSESITDWEVGGALSYSLDGPTKTKWDFQISRETSKVFAILSHAQSASRSLAKFLQSVGVFPGTKTMLTGPNLVLSHSFKYHEVNDSSSVEPVYKINISAAPLFALGFSVDILDALLINPAVVASTSGLSDVLYEIKKAAAEGVGSDDIGAKAEITVEFESAAQIEGNVTWEKAAGAEFACSGEIKGHIPLSLTGKASITVSCFWFKAGAGANVGGESGVSASFLASPGNDGPQLQGRVGWDGLKVFYAAYATASFTVTGKSPRVPRSDTKSALKGKSETPKEVTLLPAAWWPSLEGDQDASDSE